MSPITKQVSSGVLGGAAFLIFLNGFHLAPILAGFFGLATFAGLQFALPGRTAVDEVVPGVARADWLATLAQGQKVAEDVRRLVGRNPKAAMARTMMEIAEVVDRITLRLKEDPECHKLVGLFLTHEANLVLPVLGQYMELVGKAHQSASLEKQLRRSEKIIPLIRDKMDEHYQKLLSSDLMAFEVASETLAAILGVDEYEIQQLEDQK